MPGSIAAIPLPIVTEQPLPGGVSWTTRKFGDGESSTSTLKPQPSA